eukprot:UN04229
MLLEKQTNSKNKQSTTLISNVNSDNQDKVYSHVNKRAKSLQHDNDLLKQTTTTTTTTQRSTRRSSTRKFQKPIR